jgi:hypothetical protein
VCIYRDDRVEQEDPLVCASRNTVEAVENGFLYFTFGKTIIFDDSLSPVATIQVEGAGTAIELPYTTSTNQLLQFNTTRLNGSLDVSTLSSFRVEEAFNDLIVANILRDTWLLVAMGICVTLTASFIGILIFRSQRILLKNT